MMVPPSSCGVITTLGCFSWTAAEAMLMVLNSFSQQNQDQVTSRLSRSESEFQRSVTRHLSTVVWNSIDLL